jgi:hypothetical protein
LERFSHYWGEEAMQPVTAGALTVDRGGLVALARRMVQTPSLSGEEGPVARIVAEAMQAVGLADVSIDPLHNVVGCVYGRRPEPELLFNGHIDHVPPGEAPAPYSGEIADGARFGVTGEVLIGRGACDMKSAVAAMLFAVKALKDGGAQFRKTFVMTAVAREEMARGEAILYLLERCGLSARMAVSGEPRGSRSILATAASSSSPSGCWAAGPRQQPGARHQRRLPDVRFYSGPAHGLPSARPPGAGALHPGGAGHRVRTRTPGPDHP